MFNMSAPSLADIAAVTKNNDGNSDSTAWSVCYLFYDHEEKRLCGMFPPRNW